MVAILTYVLKLLARGMVRRYKPFIVAITGSAGKTSAKEAVFAALSEKERTRKTSANLNNELGLPLSILGDWSRVGRPAGLFWMGVMLRSILRILLPFQSYPKVLVLEYAADGPGDIGRLLSIAKPDIGVVTAIGSVPVHVENYSGGIEEVFREKAKLVASLSASKTAVLNADDPFFAKLKERTRAKIVSYGFSPEADVRISHFAHVIRNSRIEGISCKIQCGNSLIPISIPTAFSVSHAYAAACALAVALERDINPIKASAYIHNYHPVHGRSVLMDGIKGTQIVDESYNSSPLALETALGTLKVVQTRRIAVLGDMLELGDYTLKAHEHAGELVAGSVDVLITVGMRAKFIAYKAKEKGLKEVQIHICETAEEAGRKLQELVRAGDVVLIKGSRSIGLEKVVEEVRETSV
jgi:UDP-N-acetylmuramoyl-tripeptide--D-alanyl-D-alanine ligase